MLAEPQSLIFLTFITMILFLIQISGWIGGFENNCCRMVESRRRTGILKRRTGQEHQKLQASEAAGINRSTLYQIEKGNPSVSLGAWFNVFLVLDFQDDFLKPGADDIVGRKLQDIKLLGNKP